jgi:glycine/sarcosine N-methyltransferase
MYDAFSSDYDRFVNWDSRLAYELPFIEQQIHPMGMNGQPVRVLDAACGTGMHTLALAQRGYAAAGADLSAGMIARAVENARSAGLEIPFTPAGFGSLASTFRQSPLFPFDAVLCLGNSLPHLLTGADLTVALADFAACLRPGGKLLVQNRNFDAVLAARQRWMEPQAYRQGEAEWVFIRLYDYLPDGLIDFNILTLHREGGSAWQQRVTTTRLRPLLQADLTQVLSATGFNDVSSFGDMTGSAYNPASSGNLVVTAQKRS